MFKKSLIFLRKRYDFRTAIVPFLFVFVPFLGIIGARLLGGFQYLEWSAYDWYVKLRPPSSIERRIVIVGYSETDIQQLGKPIMSDRTLAELIEKIRAQQPRAIGLDIYRDLPEPPSYKELAESFKSSGSKEAIADRVLSGYDRLERVFQSTPQLVGVWKVGNPEILPPPTLLKLGRVASVDLIEDGDKVVRRGMLIITSQSGKNLPSLGFSVALKYLRKSQIKVKFDSESNAVLGRTTFRRFFKNDGGYVGADAGDYQTLLDFRPLNSFPVVSVTDVLQNRISADLFRDRIVLIGPTAESKKDFFFTPHSRELGGFPRQVPGVEIQANIASQVLASTLDGRPLIQTWSDPFEYLFILGWGALAVITVWRSEQWQGNKKAGFFVFWASIFCLLHCTILTIATYLAFLQGYWLPVAPGLCIILSGTAATAFGVFIKRDNQWKMTLKAQNEELAKEKAQKQLALKKARVGFWEWDVETDALVVSEEFIHLFHLENRAVPRTLKSLLELVHEDDRVKFEKFLSYLVTECLSKTVENGIEPQKTEFRIVVKKSADITNTYYITSYFQFFETNQSIMGILIDHTESYMIRAGDREKFDRLNFLLNQSNALFIITIELDCTIVYSTPSTTRALGYALEDLTGENLAKFIHLNDRGNFINALELICSGLTNREKISYKMLSSTGSWVHIESELLNDWHHPSSRCIIIYSWRKE